MIEFFILCIGQAGELFTFLGLFIGAICLGLIIIILCLHFSRVKQDKLPPIVVSSKVSSRPRQHHYFRINDVVEKVREKVNR